ncbi:MAG TPA: hypothetical protein VGL72_26475 [Bryobacteraceae bacterium]|jgi:hypothetical protein
MPGRATHVVQNDAISKVVELAPHSSAFKSHVRQVIASPAFKGSRRSQQFLQFVVENALDGHFGELKERNLGIKLFDRPPSYNTADDAIVRVTACDVRKRLLQYYSEVDSGSEFRIELPPGSYIPEFQMNPTAPPAEVAESFALPAIGEEKPVQIEAAPGKPIAALVAYTAITICIGILGWLWLTHRLTIAGPAAERLQPWSALFQANRHTHVVFCDPEIVTIQKVSDSNLSVSDYANQNYWPSPLPAKPELQWIRQSGAFRGATVAAVDAAILLRISSLGIPGTARDLEVHTARSLHLADFKTEDNFVVLGSPRSNPWVGLFQNQLDFSFEFDPQRKQEFIRNKRPGKEESPAYIPTAGGWDTGQAYSIIAMVGNPNQTGHVLLIAGSNAEATEAAGKLATNVTLMAQTLKNHGIDPKGPVHHFEILLQVSTLAGSFNSFDVIAFHPLSDRMEQAFR